MSPSEAGSPATVLYDEDCGLCRWLASKLLAWDRHRRLRPLAIQTPDAERLLAGMSEEQRMDSWHLVDADGVSSAGAAFPRLLRRLPGGRPFAALTRAAPGLSERAYRLVAENRDRLGPLISRGAKQRADRRLAERSRG